MYVRNCCGAIFVSLLMSGCGPDSGSPNVPSPGTDNTGPVTEPSPDDNAPSGADFFSLINVAENSAWQFDVNTGNEGVDASYSLSGADAADFSISDEGVLTLVEVPNYELKNRYAVTVTISEGDDANFRDLLVSITDVSESEADNVDLAISSEAFKSTGAEHFTLPLAYTCDGVNGGISPLLSWSDVPDTAVSYVLTMHSPDSDHPEGDVLPQFTVFNIPASTTTLLAGDMSAGIAAEGDMSQQDIVNANGQAYSAPCAPGAGSETDYRFTVYALSDNLNLTSSASQEEVLTAIVQSNALIASQTLTTKRIRWDEQSIASDLHVPTSVPSTCEEKAAHYELYSRVHDSIVCDEDANQLNIVSHIPSGLKTKMPEQQLLVGITQWLGHITLVRQNGLHTRIRPSFYDAAQNNFPCDSTIALGYTVDGQIILPYPKDVGVKPDGDACGPTDGHNYADRDTVIIGELDQCYGHAPGGNGYHLHGPPVCLMDIHDPSKPLAYMADGIPLYFGQAGGTVENTTHGLITTKDITPTNYGAGQYEHLDFRPSDVKDDSNPLNVCNAYDINGDGAVSGYVYYTTKDAPYTIGCFMGELLESPNKVGLNEAKLVGDRSQWQGIHDVDVVANYYDTFNGKIYDITEVYAKSTSEHFTQGEYSQLLWRILDESDVDYDASVTCYEFRYRQNRDIVDSDITEVLCTGVPESQGSMDFTPFG